VDQKRRGAISAAFRIPALAHAHRMLGDPRQAGGKISSIALDAGFGDLSYFYRVFRRHYGASPSDVRAGARRDH
jgi:AraC-like DNA-binding protein